MVATGVAVMFSVWMIVLFMDDPVNDAAAIALGAAFLAGLVSAVFGVTLWLWEVMP